MYDNDRSDVAAFRELAQLIRALGDEMDGWRRRAQAAETRLRELEPDGEPGGGSEAGEALTLVEENEQLRSRIDVARDRTRTLADRMRFLRQQLDSEGQR